MTRNQPRDENGRFRQLDKRKMEAPNSDQTVADIDESGLSPAIDWVNVSVEYLEEAIERAEHHDDMVRIGTINKTRDVGEGRKAEEGLVCLKGAPSHNECVVVAGLRREWDKEGVEK